MSRPYVFINEQMQTFWSLRSALNLSSKAETKFAIVNPHLNNQVVLPGQLVIVPDPTTSLCTAEEAVLMNLGRDVSHAMMAAPARGDAAVLYNYELAHALLTYGSLGVASVTGPWAKHLEGIQKTLGDIDLLHKEYLRKGAAGSRTEFLSKRQALLAVLERKLGGFASWGIGLNRSGPIKKMLGISTKSYLENGHIKGYAAKIGRVSKAVGFMKKGGMVGIGLSVGDAALSIQEACSTGRSDECRRAKFIETGKAAGGLGGASAGGSIGSSIGTLTCAVVFGLPTGGAGVLACGIAGAAIGGYVGGTRGSLFAEEQATVLYEAYQ